MKTCLIESTKISRRSFLQALGALTLSGSLAACGGTGKENRSPCGGEPRPRRMKW